MNRVVFRDGVAWLAMTALLCLGAIAVALGAGGAGAGPLALDGRPGAELHQPWRFWTSAWVHWSLAHLAVNLAGAAVVGAVGWRARMPAAAALAWFVAWPLTQGVMMLPDGAWMMRAMPSYGGLSGVLHAGVTVLGLTLMWPRRAKSAPAARPESGFVVPRNSAIESSRITEGPWAMTSLDELSTPRAGPAASRLDVASDARLTPAQAARHRWIGAAILAGTVAKVLMERPWDLTLRPSAMLGIQVAPVAHACGLVAGTVAWGLTTWWTAALPRRAGR